MVNKPLSVELLINTTCQNDQFVKFAIKMPGHRRTIATVSDTIEADALCA